MAETWGLSQLDDFFAHAQETRISYGIIALLREICDSAQSRHNDDELQAAISARDDATERLRSSHSVLLAVQSKAEKRAHGMQRYLEASIADVNMNDAEMRTNAQ